MKLYCHPLSTASRPVLLFAAEHDLALELRPVDLARGEHLQPAFAALNPSLQVPVLDDEGFLLSESAAILRYLADKTGSPAYPTEPRGARRATISTASASARCIDTGRARPVPAMSYAVP